MRSIVKTITHDSRQDTFRIVPIGDVHLGNRACDEALLRATIEDIRASPNTFWIGMGDIVDAVGRFDKRHREGVMATWLRGEERVFAAQRAKAIEYLKPIGHKCLAYLQGNHEDHLLKAVGADLYYSVIEGIQPTDDADLAMGMSGFLLLKFQRCDEGDRKGGTATFRFFLHHGYGGGALKGGKIIGLERLPGRYAADVYMMGHNHDKIATPFNRVETLRNGAVVEQVGYTCNTGGFLCSALEDVATYTETKGMAPLARGTIEVYLTPGAKDINKRIRILM